MILGVQGVEYLPPRKGEGMGPGPDGYTSTDNGHSHRVYLARSSRSAGARRRSGSSQGVSLDGAPLFTEELTALARGWGETGHPVYFTAQQVVDQEDRVLADADRVLGDAPLIGGANLGPLRDAMDRLMADRGRWASRVPGAWFGTPLETGKVGGDSALYQASLRLMQTVYQEAAGVAGGTITEAAAREQLEHEIGHPLAPDAFLGALWAKYQTPIKIAALGLGVLIALPYLKPVVSRLRALRGMARP